MQIESYESRDLAPKGDRIHVPGTHPAGALAPVTPPPPTPRLFAVFAVEIRKRKGLLGVWLVLTAFVAGAVVFKFARPLYRAEGKFSYIPNYRGGPNALYTPPNIQTATQMLRSADVLEPVRQAHVPDMSKDDFGKAVRVEIAKQSEFLDVTFDHPDPAVAAAVANDLQARALAHFKDVRKKALTDASAQLETDYQMAGEDLEGAKDRLRAASLAKGVPDLASEKKAVERAIEEIEAKLRDARDREAAFKTQIKHQEALRDAPPDPNERSIDEGRLSLNQQEMSQLQAELQNESTLDEAKRNLAINKAKEETYRPLLLRGNLAQAEYDEVVQNIERNRLIIQRWEQKGKQLAVLRKQHEDLKKQAGTGRTVRRDVQIELDRLRRELAATPTTIATFRTELEAKRARMTEVLALEKDLGPKIEEEAVYRRRFQEFAEKKTESGRRGRDVNADDLRVHAAAEVPTAPYSSNAPKLALAIAGASALVFLGYIGLFALPQLSPAGPAAGPAAAPVAALPRAVVALVPYIRESNGHPAANGVLPEGPPKPAAPPPAPEPEPRVEVVAPVVKVEPVPQPMAAPVEDFGSPAPVVEPPKPEPRVPVVASHKPAPRIVSLSSLREPAPVVVPAVRTNGPVRALAERIVEENVGRGGIVLFAPTVDQLRVTPVIGDLGRILTDRGDRVLVFDARPSAETPAWAGARAPTVAGFLGGQSAAGLGACFAPTAMKGVEYSRGDLSGQIDGVMAAHRFRQLVEEMQERYSLVFVVTPPVTLDGADPVFGHLAEGMVLVAESTAPSADVHAYIESLTKRVSAPLYGTLTVPRA